MRSNFRKTATAAALLLATSFAFAQYRPCAENENSQNCSAGSRGMPEDFSSSENVPVEVHKKILAVTGDKFAGSWLSQEGNEPQQLNIALTSPISQSNLPKTKIKIKMVLVAYNLKTLHAVQSQIAKLMLEPDSKILSVAVNVIANKVDVRASPQNLETVKQALIEKNYDTNIFKMEQSGAIYYGSPAILPPGKY